MRKHNVGLAFKRLGSRSRDEHGKMDRSNRHQQLSHGVANDRDWQYAANQLMRRIIDPAINHSLAII